MSWIVPIQKAGKVPRADASGERSENPEIFALANGDKSVPVVTSHCRAVTFYFTPSTALGSVLVNQRATDKDAWSTVPIDTIDVSGGSMVSQRYDCPAGQFQFTNSGAVSLAISVEGLSANRGG